MLQVYRYELSYINSNMYIILNENEAVVIDPNISDEALALLKKNDIKRVFVLLTHEHFDHTLGVLPLSQQYDITIIAHRKCADSLLIKKNNRPLSLLLIKSSENQKEIRNFFDSIKPYVCHVDIVFDNTYEFEWGMHHVKMISTPGHSRGSCCIELDDEYIFTGDSMIPDIPVITRYPGGSQEDYDKITLPYLKSVPLNKYIMPGHGMPCRMYELEYRQDCFVKR